jgi:hypothetical protein
MTFVDEPLPFHLHDVELSGLLLFSPIVPVPSLPFPVPLQTLRAMCALEPRTAISNQLRMTKIDFLLSLRGKFGVGQRMLLRWIAFEVGMQTRRRQVLEKMQLTATTAASQVSTSSCET